MSKGNDMETELLDMARIAVNACEILADECEEEGHTRAMEVWRKKAAKAKAIIASAETKVTELTRGEGI